MDLSKILAISGKPGLYKMLSQTKSGFVVESLTDQKRFPVYAHERVSSLEEISIFTTIEEDLPLKEVFKKMKEKLGDQPGPDASGDIQALKTFFKEAIPEYDPERVYVSDMKKAVSWYNLLNEKGMLVFEDENAETGDNPEANPAEVKDEEKA
jgi:hypothetical protein